MGRSGVIELTCEWRLSIYSFLSSKTTDGKLSRGAVKSAREEFNCSRDVLSRICEITLGVQDAEELLAVLKPKTCNRGRKG